MPSLSSADTIAIVLCITFLAYVAAILGPLLRRTAEQPGNRFQFQWHLIIPCLDEADVIARSIHRLRADHPIAHLWCVDDDSADGTGQLLSEVAAHDPYVHVISRRKPDAQQGKGAALNAAWRQIRQWNLERPFPGGPSNVIVGVIDADGRLAADAFNVLAGESAFGVETVDAVQVQVRILNRGLDRPDADDAAAPTRIGRLLVTLQDLEFRTVIAAMQHLRHRLGSAGMGGNGQFTRLHVLNRIADEYGTPWHGALLEDFELGLHVLFTGGHNSYCDETWVAQEGIPNVGPLLRQRARWAQGGMQCSRYLRQVLNSRRLTTPAALEICYFLLIPWTQLIGTVVYTMSFYLLGSYMIGDPGGIRHWVNSGGWGLFPLITVFGIVPIAIWGVIYRLRCEPNLTRRRALVLGIAYWLYTYLMVAAVWRAAYRLIRSRNGWVKTRRISAGPLPSQQQPGDLRLPAAPESVSTMAGFTEERN